MKFNYKPWLAIAIGLIVGLLIKRMAIGLLFGIVVGLLLVTIKRK